MVATPMYAGTRQPMLYVHPYTHAAPTCYIHTILYTPTLDASKLDSNRGYYPQIEQKKGTTSRLCPHAQE